VFSINAVDPTGSGCLINVQLPKRTSPSAKMCHTWGRVAAHVAAGNRLRARLRTAAQPTSGEAVLSAAGKIEHAEEAAKTKDSQRALRDAAKAVDRARGKLRRSDPDAALAEWKGLVAARWTLVDLFDSDGKHYLVARRNDALSLGLDVLSARERQVLGFVALGHPNKLVAYELGLSASTVSVLLHRAARKLGVSSRKALIEAYLAATRGPTD
jgi:DNA-binding CsgD family transcriptional regulator